MADEQHTADGERRFKFTRARIAALEPADKLYVVRDTQQPGLECRVLPSGHATLQVHKRPAGSARLCRVRICAASELPLDWWTDETGKRREGVRQRAQAILTELAAGIDPNAAKRRQRAQETAEALTLEAALDNYVEDVRLAKRTVSGYKGAIRRHLSDWANRPLHEITPDALVQRHRAISKAHPSAANNMVRVVRLLFEHNELEWTPYRRRMKRRWHKEQRRTRYIAPAALADWWAATEAIAETRSGTRREAVPVYPHGELWRDFFQFLILSGLRRRECSDKLLWRNIDLKARTIAIPNTKNGRTHMLPLSDHMVSILERRKAADPKADGPFIAIAEPKKAVAWVVERSGVDFSCHDCRRSFLTYGEALDFGMLTLKSLANHAMNDVTSGYVQVSVERLREPMQRITDYVLRHAGVKASADVVALNPAQQQSIDDAAQRI